MSVIAVLAVLALLTTCSLSPQAVTPASARTLKAAQDIYRFWVYGGLPKTSRQLPLLQNTGYLVGYDESRKNPGWVAYRLFKVEHPEVHLRPAGFMTDGRTTAKVKPEDYTGSHYDRGHMAPNSAIDICYGREAQRETFLMSNICPQKPELNQHVWERLEKTELADAGRFEEVWVIDGPIYDDNPTTWPSGVKVPARFFKILLDEEAGQPRMLAFIIPQEVNGDEQLPVFLVSVDLVEQETGLNFFSDLEDTLEERLESQMPKEMW
jgi:endonuclease G